MCIFCQSYPVIVDKLIEVNEHRYGKLSIRSDSKNLLLSLEWFSIIQPGDTYWLIPGQHICNICLRRNISGNHIQWVDNDFTKCPLTINGTLVSLGTSMLNKTIKLKAFI